MDEDKDLIGLWITIGILLGAIFIIIILLLLRCHFRGPLKGSNNRARLDDRTVAITGKVFIFTDLVKKVSKFYRSTTYQLKKYSF